MSLRLCGHLKEDGIPSGSPRDRRRSEVCDWRLPPLRTLRDIQRALQRIADELWSGRLDPDRAGPMLYATQQAALPFRNRHKRQK